MSVGLGELRFDRTQRHALRRIPGNPVALFLRLRHIFAASFRRTLSNSSPNALAWFPCSGRTRFVETRTR